MKALIAGWFSFENGHATGGDLLARDLACEWLSEAGYTCDVALVPPFGQGVDWRQVNPLDYSLVLFVCGPFVKGELETAFFERFSERRLVGLDLSMSLPLEEWNPFDLLIERDSSARANPDIVFLSRKPHVPVVGICLVEYYEGDRVEVEAANTALQRLVAGRELSVVEIDTRLDENRTGLRSPAEIESLIARLDVIVTTRLHGMVLALKNRIPVVAIDPVAGGGKIVRQAETIGWPVSFSAGSISEEDLALAFDYCLTEEARRKAEECRGRAIEMAEQMRAEFLSAIKSEEKMESRYQARLAQARAGEAMFSSTDEIRKSGQETDVSSNPLVKMLKGNAKSLLNKFARRSDA